MIRSLYAPAGRLSALASMRSQATRTIATTATAPAQLMLDEEARIAAVEAAAQQAPRIDPLFANPFISTVEAWVHDFQSSRPIDIVKLNGAVFAGPQRVDLIHRAVLWQRDGMRQGTHATKGISDIRGTTRKQAPQKGGGRARIGTHRAPQFRGGATVFGPKPRDHSTELPRKVYWSAMRAALAAKFAQDQLVIVDKLCMDSHKTRDMIAVLKNHLWEDRTLLLATGSEELNEKLVISSRNLQNIECTTATELDVYRMLQRDLLVLDSEAVLQLEQRLAIE